MVTKLVAPPPLTSTEMHLALTILAMLQPFSAEIKKNVLEKVGVLA